MESDLGMLDVLLFAFIAAFLGYRLYSVLGQKHEGSRKRKSHIVHKHEEAEKIVVIEEDDALFQETKPDASAPIDPNEPLSVKRGVAYIQEHDPDFCEDDFLTGAKGAFEMIVAAYASGKVSKIKTFVSDAIYTAFQSQIKDRDGPVSLEVVEMISADLMKVWIEDKTACLKVQFVSLQKDESGDTEQITDDWVFERKLKTNSPVWKLVKM